MCIRDRLEESHRWSEIKENNVLKFYHTSNNNPTTHTTRTAIRKRSYAKPRLFARQSLSRPQPQSHRFPRLPVKTYPLCTSSVLRLLISWLIRCPPLPLPSVVAGDGRSSAGTLVPRPCLLLSVVRVLRPRIPALVFSSCEGLCSPLVPIC